MCDSVHLVLHVYRRLGVCCEGTYVLHLTSTSTSTVGASSGTTSSSSITQQDTVLECAAQALCNAANVKVRPVLCRSLMLLYKQVAVIAVVMTAQRVTAMCWSLD
jgi:hypothetical protein